MHHRAIKDTQKHERHQAILDEAWRQFQTASYEDVTIAGVASALGLAKGTLYLYFHTKEELFLALVTAQLTDWFAEVDAQLAVPVSGDGITHVVAIICAALAARPGLTRLLAILHTILERNIDQLVATQFKHFLSRHFQQTGALLEGCLPFLAPGAGAQVLLRAHALVIGLRHVADPAPIVQVVLQDPALSIFIIDFAREFAATLTALLIGLEHQTQQEHH